MVKVALRCNGKAAGLQIGPDAHPTGGARFPGQRRILPRNISYMITDHGKIIAVTRSSCQNSVHDRVNHRPILWFQPDLDTDDFAP